jgi:hypothetical protein
MKRIGLIGAVALVIGAPLAFAASFSFTGAFVQDDDKPSFTFTIFSPGVVTIRTYGYAGGTNSASLLIPAGGFDPTIQFFDSTGLLVGLNQDGGCGFVGQDPVSLACWDSYYSQPLAAGSYTLFLTEYDNQANGPFLSDGFNQDGQGNFTGPEFLGSPGSFISADTNQRTSAWALDIVGVDQAAAVAPPPVPAVGVVGIGGRVVLAMLLGAVALVALRRLS